MYFNLSNVINIGANNNLLAILNLNVFIFLEAIDSTTFSIIWVGLNDALPRSTDAHDDSSSDTFGQFSQVMSALLHFTENVIGKAGLIDDFFREKLVVNTARINWLLDVVLKPQMSQGGISHWSDNLWATTSAEHQSNTCIISVLIDKGFLTEKFQSTHPYHR